MTQNWQEPSREKRAALNKALEGLLGRDIGERVEYHYEGTRQQVEKVIENYEALIIQLSEDKDAIEKYRQFYEYKVTLSFVDQPKTASMGEARNYQTAYQKAEQGFPFEISKAVQERVYVKMAYDLEKKVIEKLRKRVDSSKLVIDSDKPRPTGRMGFAVIG